MNPLVILFSAAFTGATVLSMGLLLLQRLQLRLRQGEVLPLGFALGSALLSLTVFLSLTFWIARPSWFAVVGGLSIAAALFTRAWRVPVEPSPAVPKSWQAMLTAALLLYGVYTFINALAPEISPDGVAYHLGIVGRYFRNGGFDWYTTNMYANLPMGVEMLFLFAYSFGRHSAASLTHWQFLMLLPFLVLAIARRFDVPKAGVIAAILTFACPVILLDGSSAYVDVAAGFSCTALFLALIAFEQEPSVRRWLVPVGTLAGFAYGCKMTAAPAVVFALLFTAWIMRKSRTWSWRQLIVTAALAGCFIAPWLIKNTVMVGNPFSPFLNRVFPNPYIRISFEEDYRENYKTYYGTVPKLSMIPLEVTVRGAKLNGLLGPIFLLTPLALLSLRTPLGRRALLAALFFSATYFGNIGTRFLIAAVPLLSLALAQLFEAWRVGPLVIGFVLFTAWPGVMEKYADPYSWRLFAFRWKAAWRIEREYDYLARMMPNFRGSRLVEERTPPDARVFTYNGVAEAYTSRQIDVAYQAGLNNAAGEILASGVVSVIPGTRTASFRFNPVQARRVRIIQTANTSQIWSLSELRVLGPGGEDHRREQWWRLRASPNPWDVQWAFDNCTVTRWKAWQKSTSGEFIEMDFLRPLEVGGIRAEMSPDQPDVRMRIDVDTGDGKWHTVSDKADMGTIEAPAFTRRIAIMDLKRLGYTHLVVEKSEFLASDIYRNEKAWGLTRLGDSGDVRLYKLD